METVEAEYLEDDDGGPIYAALGPMANDALFRLHSGRDEWEFLVPGTRSWDWVHQRIYRNGRVTALDAGRIATLPPLPPIPGHDPVRWEDNFRHAGHFPEARFPQVAKWLRWRNPGRLPAEAEVFVVLTEDTYESSFGDGEFHDLRGVFVDEASAADEEAGQAGEWRKVYRRRARVSLESQGLRVSEAERALFDQYGDEELLEDLEERLASGP